jgi:hypothetical protein
MNDFSLSSIPGRLQWRNRPLDWNAGDGARLTITASELTDLFIDPSGSGATDKYFSLGRLDYPKAGFASQSPTGKNCTSVFSDIIYRPGALKDRRNGE